MKSDSSTLGLSWLHKRASVQSVGHVATAKLRNTQCGMIHDTTQSITPAAVAPIAIILKF